MELHICFDLGADSLKVGFAFNYNGKDCIGKIVNNHYQYNSFPAHAYYDEKNKRWLYADVVDRLAVDNFRTVVKIKDLFNMLRKRNSNSNVIDKKTRSSNKELYNNDYQFPVFSFPNYVKEIVYYKEYFSKYGKSFTSTKTPKEVCEGYFEYIKTAIDIKIAELEKAFNVTFSSRKYIVIYPLGSGYLYETEYKRIIDKVFKTEANNKYNSIKVLCKYIEQNYQMEPNDRILIFDMGEDKISVAKACLSDNKTFFIESANGHNLPLNIGGKDFDTQISVGILNEIDKRETVGTDSFGEESHIVETGLLSKQYMFMNDIKYAKKSLSNDQFPSNEIAVTVSRDLLIQKILKREDIKKYIGMNGNTHLANEIKQYIIDELNRTNNADVTKIFFAGGLIETYGLEKYLNEYVKYSKPAIRMFTVKAPKLNMGLFGINLLEDSVYAAASAGAWVSLHNYEIITKLSKSFGTYYDRTINSSRNATNKIRYYHVIADKGTLLMPNTIIDEDRCTKLPASANFRIGKRDGGVSESTIEELYSSTCGREDFEKNKFKSIGTVVIDGARVPIIGNYVNGSLRRANCSEIGIDIKNPVLSNAIVYYFQNVRVDIVGFVNAKQGFIIVDDGVVMPYIETDREACGTNTVQIRQHGQNVSGIRPGTTVPASDIELRYEHDRSFSI